MNNEKYTNEQIEQYKNKLREMISKPNWKNHFLKNKNKDLLEFIECMTPLLQDQFFKLSTKIYWVLNDLHEFPKCKECGHVFNDRNVSAKNGYQQYCSYFCMNRSKEKQQKTKNTCKERYNDPNYHNTDKFKKTYRNKSIEEKEAIKEKRRNTCNERFGYDCNFSTNETKQKTKETNLKKYGVEYPAQKKDIYDKVQAAKIKKYGNKTGSIEKMKTHWTSETRQKSKETCLKRYGIENGGGSKQAQEKIRKRYRYNEINFDSSPEIAIYIYLKDHDIDFEYQPNISFEYEHNGKVHKYWPDFRVKDEIWEIKGNQFLKEDGTWQNPYDHSIDNAAETKHQCCLKNGVKILYNDDYQQYLKYVDEKYGKDYLKTLRNV